MPTGRGAPRRAAAPTHGRRTGRRSRLAPAPTPSSSPEPAPCERAPPRDDRHPGPSPTPPHWRRGGRGEPSAVAPALNALRSARPAIRSNRDDRHHGPRSMAAAFTSKRPPTAPLALAHPDAKKRLASVTDTRRSRKSRRQRPTLPGRPRPSTIGAEGLNCWVRDGTRCFPLAKAAGNPGSGQRVECRAIERAEALIDLIWKIWIKPHG